MVMETATEVSEERKKELAKSLSCGVELRSLAREVFGDELARQEALFLKKLVEE